MLDYEQMRTSMKNITSSSMTSNPSGVASCNYFKTLRTRKKANSIDHMESMRKNLRDVSEFCRLWNMTNIDDVM